MTGNRFLLHLVLVGVAFGMVGCGGSAPPAGSVVAENPAIYQDREKAISNAYKKMPPQSPFRK